MTTHLGVPVYHRKSAGLALAALRAAMVRAYARLAFTDAAGAAISDYTDRVWSRRPRADVDPPYGRVTVQGEGEHTAAASRNNIPTATIVFVKHTALDPTTAAEMADAFHTELSTSRLDVTGLRHVQTAPDMPDFMQEELLDGGDRYHVNQRYRIVFVNLT